MHVMYARERPVLTSCTLALPVYRKYRDAQGKRRAPATRLAPSGVCCHFGGGFPPTRCKRRRQQRRTGTVCWRWPRVSTMSTSFPVLPPSFLVCVLVFNTERSQLSNQTKVNLCSQA